MATIIKYENLPIDSLVIGKGQVRTDTAGQDLDTLANSIKAQGLLQPIVVCEATDPGKWQILTGQRRFLAHKLLKRDVITAAILSERVSEVEAKAISITENLVRRHLSGKELIDGVTFLYNKYGSQKAVVEATGLSAQDVRSYVKYQRLIPELKKQVDDGGLDVKVALKAQDAADNDSGRPDPKIAIILAKEMAAMTNVQQKKLAKNIKQEGVPLEAALERAKSGDQVTQILVTLTEDTSAALKTFANDENTNQDEAAASLIIDGLTKQGFLKE